MGKFEKIGAIVNNYTNEKESAEIITPPPLFSNEWISVDYRLPEEEIIVLVYAQRIIGRSYSIYPGYINKWRGEYSKDNILTVEFWTFYGVCAEWYEAFYWMEIPLKNRKII